MSIKRKTGFIFLGFFILYGLFSYGLQRTIINNSIQKLEFEAARKDLFRSLNAVSSEIDRIESLCRIWADLDNTYDLFIARDGNYLEPDFPETIFTINRINLILFCNEEGKATWWDCRDLVTGKRMATLDSLVTKIQATPSLLSHDPDALVFSTSGVILAEPYPILVSSHPIMKSSDEGPIEGYLIFGRFLTPDLVEEFWDQTEFAFDLVPLVAGALSADLKEIVDHITSEEPQLIKVDQKKFIYAYTTAPDINGEKALLVRSKIPRDILRTGRNIVRDAFLSMLIAGVFLFFGLRYILQRVILSPVSDLTDHMISVGKTGDLSPRTKVERRDEIGMLAKEFKRMLGKLAEKDNSLAAANAKLEEDIRERQRLIDELEKALSEVKTLSGMLPICASCKKIRDDNGYWNQIESYIHKHSDAEFSHGICPDCAKKLYPDLI